MKSQPKKTPTGNSRLRIIAGTWRGRKLPILDAEGLRPTGDRLREILFNWLAPHIAGARCLDLFSGTGALGFEALSRGAAGATMLEANRRVAAQLRANCATLNAKNAEVIEADALVWLQHQPRANFDLAFADPPFHADLWQATMEALESGTLLAPQARIYVEAPKGILLTPPDNWRLDKSKAAGAVCAYLFIRENKTNAGKWG